MPLPRLDRLIDQWTPTLRDAFMDAVYRLRSVTQVNKVAEQLAAGDVEGAIRAVGLNPAAFRALNSSTRDAFESGADTTLARFPAIYDSQGFRFGVQFNMNNPAAENWLSNHSSKLIKGVLDDQRIMIREYLQAGLTNGDNPRTTALELVGRINPNTGRREGGVIGLTNSQAQWVRNYREELNSDNPAAALERQLRDRRFDASVRRAADTGEPLDPDLIDKMVTSYNNRALFMRAEAIARTETMPALHESQTQAIDQAIESGAVSADAVGYVWHTAEDDRVRYSHEIMDGQRIANGEMFVSGLGNQLEYPGDPNAPAEDTINCRCWVEPDIDFLAGVT